MPVDYSEIYPEINGYLARPLLVNPPMCSFLSLYDGTMSLKQLELLHQIIEIRQHMQPTSDDGGQ